MCRDLYACKDEEQVLLNADFISDKQTISAGEKVYFMDKSAGEPVRWDWAFEGGEPSVSNLFSPEIVYNYPGTYTVKLRVGRGTENAETEMLKYITVVYPDEITVAFKANKTQALSDESISFTDMSVGFPSTWLWEFIPAEGRTVTSTEQNPSLVFEPGVYSVKLTVTNPKTTATLTQENYLNIIDKNSVVADITADRRMVIEGESYHSRILAWDVLPVGTGRLKEEHLLLPMSRTRLLLIQLPVSIKLL